MMAIMAEQLGLAPGQRVLEIGTGTGYNAAVLARVVGPGGSVTTVDIESDLVARARAGLAAAGYPEVRVSCADGGYGDPAGAPFDRIIVTAGAWDIAPAWLEQLAPGGRLVLPLAVRGIQLSVGLDRRDGHWVSSSAFRCGFVRVLGAFADPESFRPVGETGVFAQAADGLPADTGALAEALTGPAADLSTGVVMSSRDELGDLDLWLALAEPDLARMAFIQASSGFRGSLLPLGGLAGREEAGPGGVGPYGVCGLVEPGPDGGPPGAAVLRGYGPGGLGLAAYLAGRAREWELAGRPGIADLVLTVALRDTSAPPAEPAAGQVIFTRPHVQIAVGFRAA
jgi:protein-L-isoaspartate(D-aspartate) O-methyltransferase